MIRKMLIAVAGLALSGCVSQEQMRQERLIGQVDGKDSYRFWVYKDYQVKEWGEMLCKGSGWTEVSRENGERDMFFAQGVPISNTRIYVTIVCT